MNYDELISTYGTQQGAAKALGVGQTTVSYWRKAGIPLDQQIQIEMKTSGALKADIPQSIRTESVTAQQS